MRRFNHRLVARLTGVLMLVMAALMMLPLAVSLVAHDGAQLPLALSAVLMAVAGLLLRNVAGRHATYELHERESFWITAVVWLLVPLFGALPYLFSGMLPRFTDALFESVSGFTTTGSSVVPDPQALPRGLLLWRALTQWVGGLGLVLFVVALMRQLQVGSLKLYDAEFSGTQQRKLHPHISKSVGRMWRIYLVLTVVLAALLVLAGNDGIDSLCLALSTVSTGGFMTHWNGLQGYSGATLGILTLFMFMSGVNVALLYNFFTLRWRQLRRSQEFVVYLLLFVSVVTVLSAVQWTGGTPVGLAIRDAAFHVASTVSTCGFYQPTTVCGTTLGAVVTFLLIVSGAMAGSTGGGLKLRRLMTLAVYLRNYFTRMMHPNVVFAVKIDHQVVPGPYVNKIFGFVFLYISFIIGGAFVLTLCGLPIAESFCYAAANISNLGPSPLINSLGAGLDYALLPDMAKWMLMLLMLAGRLEIFALLAIVSPSYWRRR